MNAKNKEFENKKNQYITKISMLYEQNQNIDVEEINNKMTKINQEMKDREERTKKKIEKLKKENEETIKLIKENFQKQL